MQIYTNDNENRNFEMAKTLLEMLKWKNTNIRTVLDESDAILHAKYQLIYTVGKQMQPDGDSQRWLVPQALLKRVPDHMKKLHETFGKEKVEFGHSYGNQTNENFRTDIFTPCRILDGSVFDALKNALIDDFLDGRLDLDFPRIDEVKKADLKTLLRDKALEADAFKSIEAFSTEKQNIIYILSGLLRFEVLKLALTKRWRVNYGVDVKGQRKMAIPFKAKDVAAELTEFGHPDVAVCLTQMSYYYSGKIHTMRSYRNIRCNAITYENIIFLKCRIDRCSTVPGVSYFGEFTRRHKHLCKVDQWHSKRVACSVDCFVQRSESG